jgi:hypothetical protein
VAPISFLEMSTVAGARKKAQDKAKAKGKARSKALLLMFAVFVDVSFKLPCSDGGGRPPRKPLPPRSPMPLRPTGVQAGRERRRRLGRRTGRRPGGGGRGDSSRKARGDKLKRQRWTGSRGACRAGEGGSCQSCGFVNPSAGREWPELLCSPSPERWTTRDRCLPFRGSAWVFTTVAQ